MTLSMGRIVRAATGADQAIALRGASPFGRRVPREVVDASLEAHQRLARADRAAETIVERAQRQADDIALRAEEAGRAEAVAALAAWSARLAAREMDQDAQSADRIVALARLLAERLIGRALELDPSVVSGLAHQVLSEARAARQVRIRVRPEHAEILRDALAGLEARIDLETDESLEPGSLHLLTDAGELDARLGARLDRLAARLRDSLRGDLARS
jgi:flagellar biosynthesis/type III secretory pathway protein FliH